MREVLYPIARYRFARGMGRQKTAPHASKPKIELQGEKHVPIIHAKTLRSSRMAKSGNRVLFSDLPSARSNEYPFLPEGHSGPLILRGPTQR
jgi:hypothetical protein